MKSKIRDYKGEILDIINKLSEIQNTIDKDKKYSLELNNINDSLNKVRPSIMFYGVYNAGKSSLLNAIFGEEKAIVSDIPETDKVTYYKWKSFDLVDTPGINGPDKDYKIAKEELNKHDIIMFVIDDSDTFDSSIVAEEICNIIYANKPLILVLNNKQHSDKDIIENIREKLYDNIILASGNDRHIHEKYQFININAKKGFKGKIEDKNLLLESSNISVLESMITQELSKVSEILMLKTPITLALDLIEKLLYIIKDKINNSDEILILNLITKISKHKNNAILNAHSFIKIEIRRYKEIMYDNIVNGRDITDLQNDLSNKINNYINREYENFKIEFDKDIDSFIKEVNCNFKINININDEDTGYREKYKPTKIDSQYNNNFELEDLFEKLPMDKIPNITPLPTPIIIGVIKKFFSLFFNNSSSKDYDIEKLNYEIEMKNEEIRKQFNKKINALQELRTQINNYLYNFEQECLKISEENLIKLYDMKEESLNNFLDKLALDNKLYIEINAELENMKINISKIYNELEI